MSATVAGPAAVGGPAVGPARVSQWLTTPISVACPLLAGLNFPLRSGATTALLPVALVLPVFLIAVSGFRYARALMLAGVVAVLGGVCLTLVTSKTHQVDVTTAVSQALLVLTAVLAVGALLWVSRVIGIEWVALLYGIGYLARAASDPARWGTNAWKFAFAFPTTVIVLALLSRWRRVVVQITTLGALALVSVALDYRSFFGFCVLTGVLLVWQQIGGWRPPRQKAASVIVVGALGLAMYYGGTALLVDGALGPELQERSTAQIEASGSLLLGGRPEWSGTVRLMAERPAGFGLGVVPNTEDVNAVKTGFAGINVDPNNGYVENYMLGTTFRLHSIVADLWAYCGIAGLALAAVIVLILAGAFTTRFATRTGTPLFLFVTLLALWDMAFGPSFTNLPYVTLALVLALCPPAEAARAKRADRIADQRSARVLARRPTVLGVPRAKGGRPDVTRIRTVAGRGEETAAPGRRRVGPDGAEAESGAGPVVPLDPDETHMFFPNPYRRGPQP